MIVIAGPPGSGKSSRFPLSSFGIDSFNADERAAELNFGSFHKIPQEICARVNGAFESWVLGHITAQQDFAFETTLRSTITFQQARLARERGFWTAMDYISSGSVDESVRRIMERSYRGGHSASERLVAQIYERSTRNLLSALEFPESGIEVVGIYDNSTLGGMVRQYWRSAGAGYNRPRPISRLGLQSCSRGRNSRSSDLDRHSLAVTGIVGA